MSDTAAGPLRDLPADVAGALDDFVAAAREAFGDTLESVVLFGSAAEGALRATSDVNVIVVLSAFERTRADRLREAFRAAHAAIDLRAMFLLRDEIGAAAEAFAQKFDDIRRRHRVLWGRDPFSALTVSREALRRRVDQVLLNLSLRLRASYVERSLDEDRLVPLVADVLFLAIFTVVASIAAVKVATPFRTTRGNTALADLRRLFARLRQRAARMQKGAGGADAALLAAVFGLAALPAPAFGYARKLDPRTASTAGTSGGCGSSCGSGCGGGGDGGGCGGCGGGGGD